MNNYYRVETFTPASWKILSGV